MNRIRKTLTAVAVPAALAFGLIVSMGSEPAQATTKNNPVGFASGSGSSSGGTYSATAARSIILWGQTTGSYNVAYAPPDCWLQPEFKQPQTYRVGDPTSSPKDADSFWFWFGDHFPGFPRLIVGTNSRLAINQEFQQEQNRKVPAGWTGPNPIQPDDVWWAPNWVNTSAGWTCAEHLVGLNLSDGFLGLEPPSPPGSATIPGQITSLDLARLARAAIKLPTLKIVTSPAASTVVNLPTYVSVDYQGKENPTDHAEVLLGGAPFLSATVSAKLTNVQITSSAPSYQTTGAGSPGQACAAVNGKATSACGITFTAPSGATPYTITVSVTWKVTWTTSAGNGGTFANTPPVTQTRNIVVQEIQTQT